MQIHWGHSIRTTYDLGYLAQSTKQNNNKANAKLGRDRGPKWSLNVESLQRGGVRKEVNISWWPTHIIHLLYFKGVFKLKKTVY